MYSDEKIDPENPCAGLRHPIGATVRLTTGKTGRVIGKRHPWFEHGGPSYLPQKPFYVVRLRYGRCNYLIGEEQIVSAEWIARWPGDGRGSPPAPTVSAPVRHDDGGLPAGTGDDCLAL